MNLLTIGINHQIAPLEIREKVALTPEVISDAMKDLRSYLNQDQENNPFELSFTHDQVLAMCDDLIFHSVNPSVANELVNLLACFNSSNGGLALYVFSKS